MVHISIMVKATISWWFHGGTHSVKCWNLQKRSIHPLPKTGGMIEEAGCCCCCCSRWRQKRNPAERRAAVQRWKSLSQPNVSSLALEILLTGLVNFVFASTYAGPIAASDTLPITKPITSSSKPSHFRAQGRNRLHPSSTISFSIWIFSSRHEIGCLIVHYSVPARSWYSIGNDKSVSINNFHNIW